MLLQNGLVFFPDATFRPADIQIEAGRITAITQPSPLTPQGIDANGAYITPGLVDIHIHGCMGADFCDGTPSAVETIARYLGQQGVTSFLGTTMALGEARLSQILTLAAVQTNRPRPGATLRGVNLEGPFFAKEKKGAQNAQFIIDPDFDLFLRLFEQSKGTIRLVDIAPELPNAQDFICRAKGLCTVSLAHTAVSYQGAIAAFDWGATHVTHLFNAMAPFSHRAPGVVGAAVERAEHVELICDGIHLHPSVVRAAFTLFGAERICLISDAMQACGMPNGQYSLGAQAVQMTDGRATLADGTIAGSATDLATCLRQAVSFGIPLEQALLSATLTPARAIGLSDEIGSIQVGHQADLLLLDQQLQPRQVYVGGLPLLAVQP